MSDRVTFILRAYQVPFHPHGTTKSTDVRLEIYVVFTWKLFLSMRLPGYHDQFCEVAQIVLWNVFELR